MIIAWSKINSPLYNNIICSISGGADSDIVLDICKICDRDNKCRYFWIDTGLEYQATKDHLKYLEKEYGVSIYPVKAIKSIPTSCRQYGQPFMSKMISAYMYRLQLHDFQWEDQSFDELYKKYPKCKSALMWWCNTKLDRDDGKTSRFNISVKKWLKEYIIKNPPTFKISNKCCYYAKKLPAMHLKNEEGCDLSILGVRKAEGGARAVAYKNCFTAKPDDPDEYRPVFWYTNADKEMYKEHYNIVYSDCYEIYGLDRTGCAGCPFGKYWESELEVIKTHEPKLYKAVNNIFGDSYEYMRGYSKFVEEMDAKYGSYKKYLEQKEGIEN